MTPAGSIGAGVLSRRTVLKGMAAGGALLAAGPAGRALAASGRSIRTAGSRPYPHIPAGTDTLPAIEHIVVLMMENHTYDSYFGMLPQGDGFAVVKGRPVNANRDASGQVVRVTHASTTCQNGNHVSQSWDASHRCWDGGRMDGFARTNRGSMTYWTGDDIPFLWSLASNFTVCDRYFSSVMAQTYPNRRFLMAGSAFGQVGDPFPSPGDKPPRPAGTPSTIFDLFNRYDISWKDYFADLPTVGLFPYVLEQNPGNVVPVASFFADCAAGTLPQFSLVDPESFEGSEENPQDITVGQSYVARVVNAVMSGPKWGSTLLVFTYDEGGGYYDHVAPPVAVRPDGIRPEASITYGDLYSRYGFRVPTVVVSPWSRPGAVSSTVYDHTSILKTVETKWNLPALSARDANANDLLGCLDLVSKPLAIAPALAPAPAPTGVVSCLAANPTGPLP